MIGEIANLNIGSRPASRDELTRIEDLRAIPWVFSWAQCRLMLPGWYGFGAAVEGLARQLTPHEGIGDPAGACMASGRSSRRLLSNMDMVLAKSDIAIASRYAELVPERELRDEIFQQLRSEWQTSIDMLLAITGQQALLEHNPLQWYRGRFKEQWLNEQLARIGCWFNWGKHISRHCAQLNSSRLFESNGGLSQAFRVTPRSNHGCFFFTRTWAGLSGT